MNRTLARRLHALEVAWSQRVLTIWEALSPAAQRAVLDDVTHRLIQQGVLPPPDPARPETPLDVLRDDAPALLRQWHARTVGNLHWQAQHPEALQVALQVLVACHVGQGQPTGGRP